MMSGLPSPQPSPPGGEGVRRGSRRVVGRMWGWEDGRASPREAELMGGAAGAVVVGDGLEAAEVGRGEAEGAGASADGVAVGGGGEESGRVGGDDVVAAAPDADRKSTRLN